jgi:hypothetical protein
MSPRVSVDKAIQQVLYSSTSQSACPNPSFPGNKTQKIPNCFFKKVIFHLYLGSCFQETHTQTHTVLRYIMLCQ